MFRSFVNAPSVIGAPFLSAYHQLHMWDDRFFFFALSLVRDGENVLCETDDHSSLIFAPEFHIFRKLRVTSTFTCLLV